MTRCAVTTTVTTGDHTALRILQGLLPCLICSSIGKDMFFHQDGPGATQKKSLIG